MTNRLLQRAAALRDADALELRQAKCQARWTDRRRCVRYAAWTIDGERLCLRHAVQRMLAPAPIHSISPLIPERTRR
jgi:hypothetical protein